MTSYELPGGGKAWFVRRKTGSRCDLKPVSREGFLLTAAYAVCVSGISWFFAERAVGVAVVVAWITLILAATFLFILTAWRMSASDTAPSRRRR
jgi:hypothetical protein